MKLVKRTPPPDFKTMMRKRLFKDYRLQKAACGLPGTVKQKQCATSTFACTYLQRQKQKGEYCHSWCYVWYIASTMTITTCYAENIRKQLHIFTKMSQHLLKWLPLLMYNATTNTVPIHKYMSELKTFLGNMSNVTSQTLSICQK